MTATDRRASPDPRARRAGSADAQAIGRLLHDFNVDGPLNYFYERELD
jgi:hypothetical protein